DTIQGRFLQRDPLGFRAGDVNLYAYVSNRPTKATDPSGKLGPLAVACIFGAAIGIAGSVIQDVWNGKFGLCHTGVQALLSGLLGCAACVVLGNVGLAAQWLVAGLQALGLTEMAGFLLAHPVIANIVTGAGGIGIGSVAVLM